MIKRVGADGAYDTRACHAAFVAHGAEARIPPRKNGQLWKADMAGNRARNECLRSIKRLGRVIWKIWSDYHRRSLVETKMHCFKLLADRVKDWGFDRQMAELQVCAAILNRFTHLGTPETPRMA